MKPETSHSHSNTQFEEQDLDLKVVFKAVVIILVTTVAVVFLLKPILGYHIQKHQIIDEVMDTKLPQFDVQSKFPMPRLQHNDAMDLATFRAQEAKILDNYAWEDKDHGMVRVPIEDAMARLLQKGLPYRKEAAK